MKRLLYVLFLACLFLSCNKLKDYFPHPGSNPLPQFNKVFGGSGNDVAAAVAASADGSSGFAGYTFSNNGDASGNHGSADGWVVKLDKSGNKLWHKTLGGSGADFAHSVVATPDGGYLMAGYTQSSDGGSSGFHGGADGWLVKLDKEGNIVWQKAYGGSAGDAFYSIAKSADGGYLLAGASQSNNGDLKNNKGQGDAWVVKVDVNGTLVWQQSVGGSEDDVGYSITASKDGGCIMTGHTFSNDGDVSGFHGDFDTWVVKFDKEGNVVWKRVLGGSGGDEGYSVTGTPDGGCVVASRTDSRNGDLSGQQGSFSSWIVKLDPEGGMVWQKVLQLTRPNSIITTKGGYLVAGTNENNQGMSDIMIVKLDTNGNLLWQKNKGGTGNEETGSVSERLDGSYVLAATTESNDGEVSGSHGKSDAWVVTLKGE
jgi:hypothetical protein